MLFLLIPTLNLYSQIRFEEGYFIDNNGNRTECQIKNVDWDDNPNGFDYRLNESGNVNQMEISSIKEFGIYQDSKYVKAKVNIDKSSDNLSDLGYQRKPVMVEEELLLEALVEGKANLFVYKSGNMTRFFYQKGGMPIEQLIYKRYKASNNQVAVNNTYQQQLINDMPCPGQKQINALGLRYRKNDLIRYFKDYSSCHDIQAASFQPDNQRDVFHLSLRPRLNHTSLSIENSIRSFLDRDFGNQWTGGLGLELEFVLPFNKNKWTVLVEPTYQYFKSEETADAPNVSGGTLTAEVDYKSIEIPVGVRHYFFLSDQATIFANLSYVADVPLNSSVNFVRAEGTSFENMEIGSTDNIAIGVGFKYNLKYSLEVRYQSRRDILRGAPNAQADYRTVALIVGYRLF